MEITWACTPGPPDPVELVVKLEGRDGTSYDNWRPLGGAGPAAGTPGAERPGNHLNVSVALQARGGGATKRKAKEFRYELSQVSRLPGICCNIPSQPPAEPAPELRFIPEDNAPGLEILDEGLLASRRPDQAAVLDRAVLTAFDYGAHAQLLVTAVLDDGRRVIGRLEGQTAQGRTPSPSASRGRSSLRGGSRSTVSRA